MDWQDYNLIFVVIKTRVGLEIAEMTLAATHLLLKIDDLQILENSREYVYSEVICLLNF